MNFIPAALFYLPVGEWMIVERWNLVAALNYGCQPGEARPQTYHIDEEDETMYEMAYAPLENDQSLYYVWLEVKE